LLKLNRDCLPIRFTLGALIVGSLASDYALARETAKVLPAGIRRARVVGVQTGEIKDTYNENGDLQGLSHNLNRSVTIGDLAANADPVTQAKLNTLISNLNTFDAGLGTQLSNSNLYSDFRLEQRIYLAAFEYGVTDRLSLGLRLPVVKRTIKNKFDVNTINNAAAINAQLGNMSQAMTDGLFDFGNKQLDTAFFTNTLFTSKGYEAPKDFEKTQVGDLEVGGKYNFYRNETLYLTGLIGARAPTGARASISNPFDKGTSKEAWGLAAQFLQEVQLTRGLSLGGAAKYCYSFSDTRERAVPRNETDSLPSLLAKDGQVQQVTRKTADQIETEVSAGYKLPGEMFGLWGAYQYSKKGQDKFTGPGNLYYQGMSKNTEWALHAGEVGVEFSTIPAFRKGSFKVPMEISLLYNTPLKGRNTPMASYARMDLMLYF
jgi:hypothetical protein